MNPVIELSQLQYRYPKAENLALNIPRWEVAAGEQVFLYGKSGAGKSTLLNMLGGLIVPQAGQIQVLGQSLHDMSVRQRDGFRADHIGFIFQQFNLIPYLSVAENIRLSVHFSSKNNKVDLEDVTGSLGLSSALLKQRADQLSVGQQQRVAIARALINQPELIIADEPTSALDSENREKFLNLLMNQAQEKNCTLVFVSHDKSLADYFSQQQDLSQFNLIEEKR